MSVHYLPSAFTEMHVELTWRINITSKADVVFAKQKVLKQCETVTRNKTFANEIAIITTELCNNLVHHANGGMLFISIDPQKQITITTKDKGPGIPSIDMAMRDGFSSNGGHGLGLGIVNRIMDKLEINSILEEGTSITSYRNLPNTNTNSTGYRLDIGSATLPHPDAPENGDAYIIDKQDDSVLIALIDGIGHGQKAWSAAQTAIYTINQHKSAPLSTIIRQIHQNSLGTRGSVAALMSFDLSTKTVTHAGIGNIRCQHFQSSDLTSYISQRGTLGVRIPPNIITTTNTYDDDSVFILNSDGLSPHWSWLNHPHMHHLSADRIAQNILRTYNQYRDDASILVIKPARG